MTNTPFFIRDGDTFHPTEAANGPWDPKSLHARVIVGLLGLAIAERPSGPEFAPARFRVATGAGFARPLANRGDKGPGDSSGEGPSSLHRLPVTTRIGFEVVNHQAADGVAVGEPWLYDEQAPTGTATVAALARRKPMA